jgi:E3 ubiquitin-protein ligase RBX1
MEDTPKINVTIKKMNAIGKWTYDTVIDKCSICRNHLSDICIVCHSSGDKIDDINCSISWGNCNHAYHTHCISSWLKKRQVCPLCNSEWETIKIETNN